MEKNYNKLEEQISIQFKDFALLDRAFIHKSYINEHKDAGLSHNERLEFLGDAVLELAVTHYLFDKFPEKDEGKMTSFRSALVKGNNLAEVARRLDLGNYLKLSRGEENSGGRDKNYLLANVTEALIGAIYLDQGYDIAEKFINDHILDNLEEIIDQGLHIDSKSRFQELAQELASVTPHYELINSHGPDHKKEFTMGAYLGPDLVAEGTGPSKQKAEELAAKNAITKLNW